MNFYDYCRTVREIANIPGISEISKIQKNMQQVSGFIKSPAFSSIQYLQKYNHQISSIVNSPVNKYFFEQNKLVKDILPSVTAFNSLKISPLIEQSYLSNPLFTNQLSEIQKLLNSTNGVLSTIVNTSRIYNSFKNTGMFSEISALSKNISALAAIDKLSNLSSFIETENYKIDIPNDYEILIDDKKLTKDELSKFTKELADIDTDSSLSHFIDKIKKNKIALFFFTVLWFFLNGLIIEPLKEKVFNEIREVTGINKLIDEIDIKSWVEEVNNYISNTIIAKEHPPENNID
jgi:hypothetical protein